MLSVNGEKIKLDTFPDGTLLLKYSMRDQDINISWKYERDAEVFALICLTKHLREQNPNARFFLTMLYIPNARMDRVKVEEDVFTLKYFTELINSLEFDQVRVLDPHSEVSVNLLNNVEVISPKPYVSEAIRRISQSFDPPTTIFFTDKGGKERYSNLTQLPSVYGDKVREWGTGKILGTQIVGDPELVKDKNILIIDDIISYGGSIYYNSLKLKELGCRNLFVFATHMENNILDKKNGKLIQSGLITKFYTTNSLFSKRHSLIEVIK